MDKPNSFQALHFDRPRIIPWRPVTIGIVLAAVGAAWWLVPQAALIWLLLPFIAVIVWVASFGWRQALAELQAFLRRLEHI